LVLERHDRDLWQKGGFDITERRAVRRSSFTRWDQNNSTETGWPVCPDPLYCIFMAFFLDAIQNIFKKGLTRSPVYPKFD
jgi:hypothetical protein